ncbi:zinc-ribbon domain-containing protein [Kitasatospora purpeofusca]|uniref:zinc-ribbon domain-containing protein n=1 Tax=Kitasatospora purpeofusca TaxID=67352 RepID=UPI003800FC81
MWWRDPGCGHEWQDTPEQRDKGHRLHCPGCRTVLDSLAFHFPALAAEWSPANPVSAWCVRPTARTSFVPAWVRSAIPEHVRRAPLPSRTNGSGCAECREHGKSRTELNRHEAAERAFGQASSGLAVRHDAFVRRTVRSVDITVDITVDLPGGRKLAVEYDGSYRHADRSEVDLEKSRDLLAAGYLVARLREHPLPAPPIEDPGYAEFTVHSASPDPDGVIERVKPWASDR